MLVVTHPHFDHYGGVQHLIKTQEYAIEEIVLPPFRHYAGRPSSHYSAL